MEFQELDNLFRLSRQDYYLLICCGMGRILPYTRANVVSNLTRILLYFCYPRLPYNQVCNLLPLSSS